jgi:plasmid replication initiation protein
MSEQLGVAEGFVRKSNELIQHSRFSLTPIEHNIIYLVLSHIKTTDEDFHSITFTIPEFCRACGITSASGKHYQDIKAAVGRLADRKIWVTLPDGRETFVRWVQKAYFDKKQGTIEIRMDDDMIPFLLELKEHFTIMDVVFLMALPSAYAKRLYEFVCSIHFHSNTVWEGTYTLDYLRSVTGALESSYEQYRDFKRRVIEPSIAQINAKTDKVVWYDEIKQGRRVVMLRLYVRAKDAAEIFLAKDAIKRGNGIDPNQTAIDGF